VNRIRSIAVAGLVFGLVASIGVAGPVAAAPLPAPPTIESVTFNGPNAFNLTGTAVGTVTIDVRITAPDGQSDGGALPPNQCLGGPCLTTPYLEVTQVAGPSSAKLWYPGRSLKLISGTANDGVWRGTLSFTAWQAGGSFKVSRVVALGGSDNNADYQNDVLVDPASLGVDTTVRVSGGDAPFLAVSTSPKVIPSGYKGKVTTYFLLYQRDSKKRLSGRPITICLDNSCDVLTTDATGRASKTWNYPQNSFALFYRSNAGKYVDDVLYDSSAMAPSADYGARARVSASATPLSISLGATTNLFGNTWPVQFGDRTVVIQKWVNSKWTQLGRANIRDSGRWDYTTRPSTKGTHVYRVWRPTSGCDHAGRCLVKGTTSGSIRVIVR